MKLESLEGGEYMVAEFPALEEVEATDEGKQLFLDLAFKFARRRIARRQE